MPEDNDVIGTLPAQSFLSYDYWDPADMSN